tara:strand:- start:466 stop:585 length:120 start_codon:yes stop_codon:yes gene_type:complete
MLVYDEEDVQDKRKGDDDSGFCGKKLLYHGTSNGKEQCL